MPRRDRRDLHNRLDSGANVDISSSAIKQRRVKRLAGSTNNRWMTRTASALTWRRHEHASHDADFAGQIPELYERLLVPMLFAPYAADIAQRAAALEPSRVLETAAGTGVVTRAMAHALPAHVEIVATDLNQAMLDRAAASASQNGDDGSRPTRCNLPFDDASFDIVVCQFGAMFFPDKPAAFAQARRVLRPGGALLFNVWDRIEENEFADTVTARARPTSFPPIRRFS